MNAEALIIPHEIELTSLQPVSEIVQLNEWMYKRAAPYLSGNILEIGSGTGHISDFFIQDEIPITLSDPNIYYCQALKKKYQNDSLVTDVKQIDLTHEDFENTYAKLLGSYDTIFSLNIVEHISHERSAIANAKKLLTPGGYLILLVPVFAALYSGLDEGFEYWHRFNKRYIKKLLSQDFEIIKTRYFNLVGIVRWCLSRSMTGNDSSELQTRYQELVPVFRIEDLAIRQIGLSVVTVAEKKLL